MQARRERGSGGGQPPYHFLLQNIFFHLKSENINVLNVKNMWDFSLFIEQDVSDKKEMAFSEFVIFAVNWAITVTNNKFLSFCF